jgi:uncharacterized protein YqeY
MVAGILPEIYDVAKARPLESPPGIVNLLKAQPPRYAAGFLPTARGLMIRDAIKQALIGAMKAGDRARTGALRLVQSELKNRDIALRGAEKPPEDDVLVTEVLQKMIKQRRESIDMYRKGGRAELAEAEAAEVAVIEAFLPRQLDEAETAAAIAAITAELGATSVKDTGKVMALLKERHAGRLDMSRAGAMVKTALGQA